MSSKITAADLKAKYEKELAELERSELIASKLPSIGGVEPRVHIYNLYGTVASVVYGDVYNRSAVPMSWGDVLSLAEQLPAEPKHYVKIQACVTTMPSEFLSSVDMPPYDTESSCKIAPVTVDWVWADYMSSCMQVEWYTKIEGVGLVEIQVRIVSYRIHPTIGTCTIKRSEYVGGYSAKRTGASCWSILGTGKTINYAGGSPTDPGQTVFYWANPVEGASPAMLAKLCIESDANGGAK